MSETKSQSPLSRLLKPAALLALVAALGLLGGRLGPYLESFTQWVESLGFWGPVAFIGGYAIATVAFAPGAILTLAAGPIFGLAYGAVYVFIAATLGASLAFLAARYFVRSSIERKLAGNQRFDAIDRAVGRQGLKICLLLRLSPVFPFNLLNYALGLTQIRFSHYLLGSFGMIPATFLYVYLGALGGDAAKAASGGSDADVWKWVLNGVGLAATLVVTIVITRIARRALAEETGVGDEAPAN